MKIIEPIDIADGMIVSSTLVDENYPLWEAGSWEAGSIVRFDRYLYEALITTTETPDMGRRLHPPQWHLIGASNRWRLFDDKIGTQSTADESVQLAIQSGQAFSAITLFNLDAAALSARLEDPVAGVVWEHDQSFIDYGAANWYEFFFKPADRIHDAVIQGVPAYPNATLYLDIQNVGDEVAIGHLTLGTETEIGITCYGSSVGIKDYSRKETDEWGNTSVVERGFSKRASFDVVVDTVRVATIQKALAKVRAKPVVWIGDEKHEATIIIGFFKDFEIVIAGPSVSDAAISVEGLV